MTASVGWDPVFQPFEDGALATWYDKGYQKSEKLPLSGVFEINGKQFPYEIPTKVNRMLFVSDVHSNDSMISQWGHDYDLMLCAGDLTFNGYAEDYIPFFSHQKRPLLWAAGNHDRWHSDTVKVMGRQNDFYQKVGNIGVYVTFFDDWSYRKIRPLLADHIQDKDVDHQFFIVHYPLYSRGSTHATDNEKYTTIVEEMLDSNPNHRIRAILTGHDHLFNLFNRSNVFILLNAPAGGEDETYYKEFPPESPRYFTGMKEGPQEPVDDGCHGWEWHVFSCVWQWMKIKTFVDIKDDRLIYTVMDAEIDSVIRQFEQFFDLS